MSPSVVASFLLSTLLSICFASPPVLNGIVTKTPDGKGSFTRTVQFDFYVRLSSTPRTPDCYPSSRPIILINGLFMPTISVQVNDTLIVNIYNQLPPTFSQTASGISIHWHGLYLWDEATWMDGAAYVTQCPITPGTNFTYRFLVNEQPGTYLWHDHATANRANGLQGALIVKVPGNIETPYGKMDGDEILFLSDWHRIEGNTLAKQLNRPIVASLADRTTGLYKPIPPVSSLLINGRGFHAECDIKRLVTNPATGSRVPTCSPLNNPFITRSNTVLPQPQPLNSSFTCPHERLLIKTGGTYYLRIINAATSTYLTICFEGHLLEIVAADGTPVAYTNSGSSCIDLTNGQRYEGILRASLAPKSRSFWISVHAVMENAVPSGYALLQYSPPLPPPSPPSPPRSRSKLPPLPPPLRLTPSTTLDTWPLTPPPQPSSVIPWTIDQILQVTTHDGLLGYLDDYTYETFWKLFLHKGAYGGAVLYHSPHVNITLNTTMPVIEASGLLRWTFDDVATPSNPPCQPLMELMKSDPSWIHRNAINASDLASIPRVRNQQQTLNASDTRTSIYLNGSPAPRLPFIGAHVAQVKVGDIIGIVINNIPPVGSGGNFSMIHPIHLHGHKFWLLGTGPDGPYLPSKHDLYLNLYNPIIRDTILLPAYGWAVLRFTADNPGIWPLHCHNFWHMFMGQQMYVIEGSPDTWPRVPRNGTMPKCPSKCISSFAPWRPTG